MTGSRHLYDPFDCELCLLGAADDSRLAEEVKRIIHFLEHAQDVSLQDVAYTCACSARSMPAVLAVVAVSVADLRDRLRLRRALFRRLDPAFSGRYCPGSASDRAGAGYVGNQ